MHTEWGKVMATLNEEVDEETPLQVRLNGAATAIGKMGLLVAIFTFIVLMIRYGGLDAWTLIHISTRKSDILSNVVEVLLCIIYLQGAERWEHLRQAS
jgi:Ca2+-transporting ATPase